MNNQNPKTKEEVKRLLNGELGNAQGLERDELKHIAGGSVERHHKQQG